jgi:hypothetical protein
MSLLRTRLEVDYEAGLAINALTRQFKNLAQCDGETTLAFPLPVSANVFGHEVHVDGCLISTIARARETASSAYEEAVSKKRAAVLHEMPLPGLHVLWLGRIPPGAVVEVTTRFSLTASLCAGRAHVRIPLTVGDLCGESGLASADELTHACYDGEVDLTVRAPHSQVRLGGQLLVGGAARVPVSRPIDLSFTLTQPYLLVGRAADGSRVTLSVTPVGIPHREIGAVVLVDRSRSMAEPAGGQHVEQTKFDAAMAGLARIAGHLAEGDRLSLWQFADGVTALGAVAGGGEGRHAWSTLLQGIEAPRGDCRIGAAIQAALAAEAARDIIVITDGKSHALDVEGLAASGRRISAVLIGEDTFEGKLGELVQRTGGELIHGAAGNAKSWAACAVAALRRDSGVARLFEPTSAVVTLSAIRGGMIISAEWDGPHGKTFEATIRDRAIAAHAMSLMLPALSPAQATVSAIAEGFVTLDTSLVAIDDNASSTMDGDLSTGKIALATPATNPARWDAAEMDAFSQSGDNTENSIGTTSAITVLDEHRDYLSYAITHVAAVVVAQESAREAINWINDVEAVPRTASDAGVCFSYTSGATLQIEDRASISEIESWSSLVYGTSYTRATVPDSTTTKYNKEVRKSAILRGGATPIYAAPLQHAMVIRACSELSRKIFWHFHEVLISGGLLPHLSSDIIRRINQLAHSSVVREEAKKLGLNARTYVLALIAMQASKTDESARRVLRSLLSAHRLRKLQNTLRLTWPDERGLRRLPVRRSAGQQAAWIATAGRAVKVAADLFA